MKMSFLLIILFVVSAGQAFPFDDISTLLRQAGSEMERAKSLMESVPLDKRERSKEIDDIAKVFERTREGQQKAIDNLELALSALKKKKEREAEPEKNSENVQKSTGQNDKEAKTQKPDPGEIRSRKEGEGNNPLDGNRRESKDSSLLGESGPEDPAERWGEMNKIDLPALECHNQRQVPAQYRELIEEYYRRLGEYKE